MWGRTNRALNLEKILNISLAFFAVPSWSRKRAVIRVSTLSMRSSYLTNKGKICVSKNNAMEWWTLKPRPLNLIHWISGSLSPYFITQKLLLYTSRKMTRYAVQAEYQFIINTKLTNLLMAASQASEPSFDTSSPSTSLTFSYARFTSWIALASAGSSKASGLASSSSTFLGGPPGLEGVAWLTAGGWRTRTITARSCSCWRRNLNVSESSKILASL